MHARQFQGNHIFISLPRGKLHIDRLLAPLHRAKGLKRLVAATYQAGGKMVFYLDGVQVSSVNCGTLAASASDLQLGTSPYYSNRYMRGDIQQVSIWDDVRTAAEVAADVACDFDGTEEGLMAYWPLTLNVGTEITDQTGNHVASLVDVTWLDVE